MARYVAIWNTLARQYRFDGLVRPLDPHGFGVLDTRSAVGQRGIDVGALVPIAPDAVEPDAIAALAEAEALNAGAELPPPNWPATIDQRVDALEIGDAGDDEAVAEVAAAVAVEAATRAQAALDEIADRTLDVNEEQARAELAEQAIADALTAETARALSVEELLVRTATVVAAVGSPALGVRVAGDAADRVRIDGTGLLLGGGALAPDVNLYRGGSNLLQTDDSVKIVSPGITAVPLVVQGAASQTADLFRAQLSDGTVRTKVQANGMLRVIGSSGDALRFDADGFTMFERGVQFTGGGYGFALSAHPSSVGNLGIRVQGIAGQTADLQQWQNSAAAVMARVDPAGVFVSTGVQVLVVGEAFGRMRLNATGPSIDAGPGTASRDTFLGRSGSGGWVATATSAAAVPFTAKGAASQTAAILDVRDSADAVLAKLTPDAYLRFGSGNAKIGAPSFDNMIISVADSATAGANMLLAARQGINLFPRGGGNGGLQLGTAADSGLEMFGPIRRLAFVANYGSTGVGFIDSVLGVTVGGAGPAVTPLAVKAAAVQTAPVVQVKSSADVVITQVTAAGEWENLVAGAGWLVRSPNGTRYRVGVADGGGVVAVAA